MPRSPRSLQDPQAGATTIILVLILLALLTVGVMGMSRNALREVVTSGTGRQGAMARDTADSGIEWAVFWLDPQNGLQASGSALELRNLMTKLSLNTAMAGKTYDPRTQGLYTPGAAPAADQAPPGSTNLKQGFTVGLTYMGRLPIADMSQGISSTAFTPATGNDSMPGPDLWAIQRPQCPHDARPAAKPSR